MDFQVAVMLAAGGQVDARELGGKRVKLSMSGNVDTAAVGSPGYEEGFRGIEADMGLCTEKGGDGFGFGDSVIQIGCILHQRVG